MKMELLIAVALGWKIGLALLTIALLSALGFGLFALLIVGMAPMWLFFNLTGGENIVFVLRKSQPRFPDRAITRPLNWCSVFIILLSALWLSGCADTQARAVHAGDYYEKEQPYYTREYWREFRRR